MLEIAGRSSSVCSGVSRRKLLQAGGAGLFGLTLPQLLAAEAARIEAAIPAGALRVACDEHGKDLTTMQLSEKLRQWQDSASDIALVIGGPDGLAPSIKDSARLTIRLSSMTLPHGLARVLLAEQVYRAWSILQNHPYHRE